MRILVGGLPVVQLLVVVIGAVAPHRNIDYHVQNDNSVRMARGLGID